MDHPRVQKAQTENGSVKGYRRAQSINQFIEFVEGYLKTREGKM